MHISVSCLADVIQNRILVAPYDMLVAEKMTDARHNDRTKI